MDFIVSAWSSSYRTAHAAGLIPMSMWAPVMHAAIGDVLSRPDARTIVAYETSDKSGLSDLYGFAAALTGLSKPYVLYTFVKLPYRRMGIGEALLNALDVNPVLPFEYACRTSVFTFLTDKLPRARWNPLPARYPFQQGAK